jgi:hypothetical protein
MKGILFTALLALAKEGNQPIVNQLTNGKDPHWHGLHAGSLFSQIVRRVCCGYNALFKAWKREAMKYHVEVHYRRGPAYACDVEASSEGQAEWRAIILGRQEGFIGSIKRTVVFPLKGRWLSELRWGAGENREQGGWTYNRR